MFDIHTIETTSLGDRSYLVTDGTVAAVVDPQRDIDRVVAVAERLGVRITDVFETHIHNDYVTGGLHLARASGARYHVALADEVHFDRHGITDGERVGVGDLTIRAVHTPGHTPTHLSYVVEADGAPQAVFTGGSLLYGTVGRTDLLGPSLTGELTRAQHASAHLLADTLADHVTVQPTHGFGSFCSSASVDAGESSTIGNERVQNIALTTPDVETFVERLLGGLDVYPRYYAHMAPRNRLGPEPAVLAPPVPADPGELAARIHAGEWVVDLRQRVAFARDHLSGSYNIEAGNDFVTYLGWLMPWNLPVTLVADRADDIEAAQRQMVRIGIERPAAAAAGGVDAFAAGQRRGSYRVADFKDLRAARSAGDGGEPAVLDVRRLDEWRQGHVAGAAHVPIHDLTRRLDDVPTGPVWVHCASGFRASVAASILHAAGREPVLVDDSYDTAVELGLTSAA